MTLLIGSYTHSRLTILPTLSECEQFPLTTFHLSQQDRLNIKCFSLQMLQLKSCFIHLPTQRLLFRTNAFSSVLQLSSEFSFPETRLRNESFGL